MTTAAERRRLRFMRWSLPLAAAVAIGYALNPVKESPENPIYDLDERPADDRPPDSEREKIEALATAAVVKEEAINHNQSEFYVRATREGDGWSVHVQYLPLMPGNFCVLRMSAMGEVLEWQGGV